MKLAIFGASGATGRHLVNQALSSGHYITAMVRTLDSLQINNVGLKLIVGELSNSVIVESVIRDADAVISVLGARKGKAQKICTDGTSKIISAMQNVGVKRLIALSAYGASETHNASLFIRFVRSIISEKMRDKDDMEDLVRASNTDWTLIRPPMLTNGDASNNYRSGIDLRPGITARISRAGLASFILQTVVSGSYIHEAAIVFKE
ncbi:NAD(P)-dependent oxidoreductase [Pantoea trifolii]|uniref:SDR family oxidoreductase n=1 Tax=Pantoea trifolii TaxID=2968030 RepID=A0ABT1VS16_9GAMM|nr:MULTISPECIES: NAD(P)-binding oxidoreductase [unclassified Pantoea]MCQ8230346.1 SDR family oxidoreductase [Pantoea sp. MMK2]MCQ8239189.1 SDR family oxidoreductase [Pantoea sp. MMK3]